jgi:hypothetical protein
VNPGAEGILEALARIGHAGTPDQRIGGGQPEARP